MSASNWRILQMIWLIPLAGTLGTQKNYKYFSTTSTWEKAKADCPEGHSLPLYQTSAERSEVNRALVKEKINEIWLAYKRRNLVIWTWNDNSPADQKIVKSTWQSGRHCGVFHLRDRVIEADNCSKAGFGYICSGNISCTSDELINRACITLGGKAYLYECDVQNWYEARSRCRRYAMDLAIVKPEHYQYLGNEWYNQKRKNCMDVWIGLFKEKWEAGANAEATFSLWGSGQPALTGDCGLLTTNGEGRVYWRAENCSTKHHRLCFLKDRSLPEITSTETAWTMIASTEKGIKPMVCNMKDCYNVHFRNATIALSLICCVLLILIIWVLWICHRIQKEKIEGIRNRRDSAHGLFSICLQPCHRNKQAPQTSGQPTVNRTFNQVQQNQDEVDALLGTTQPHVARLRDVISSDVTDFGSQPAESDNDMDQIGSSAPCTEQSNTDQLHVALPEVSSLERTDECRPVSMYIVDTGAEFDITFFVTSCDDVQQILFPIYGLGTIRPTHISIPKIYKSKTTLQAKVKTDGKEWEVPACDECMRIDLSEIENVLKKMKFYSLIGITAKRVTNSDAVPDMVLSPKFTIREAGEETDLARGRIRVNMAQIKQNTEQDQRACRDDACCGGSGMSDVTEFPESTVGLGTTARGARPIASAKESTNSAIRSDEQMTSEGGSSATRTEETENQE